MKRPGLAARLRSTLRHRLGRAVTSRHPLCLAGEMVMLSTGCEIQARCIPAITLFSEQHGLKPEFDRRAGMAEVTLSGPRGTFRALVRRSEDQVCIQVDLAAPLMVRMPRRREAG